MKGRLGWWLWRPRLGGPATFGESLRIERLIGTARLLLAILGLLEVRIRLVEPEVYAPMAYIAMVFFVAHAMAALLVLRYQQHISRAFTITTSSIDMLMAVATLPLAGPLNAFLGFFLFVLASTAFRWGLRETLAVTSAAGTLVVVRAALASEWSHVYPVLLGQPDAGRLFAQVGYLAVMGLMLGSVAEEARLLRVEAAALAKLLSSVRLDAGVARAVTAAARDVTALFRASRLMLVLEHQSTRRVLRWDTIGGWSVGAPLHTDVESTESSSYFFGPRDSSMGITRRRWFRLWFSPPRVTVLNAVGHVVHGPGVSVPGDFATANPFRRLAVAPLAFGGEWSGRAFLFDPRVAMRLVALTRFLQTIVRQIAPALFNVHLQSQLQERAGALERARVARELHDGVIQSLIGVEMQLDVLRQRAAAGGNDAATDLARIQRIVHDEVLNVRDLMQQMRPVEFDPDELLDYLADMVHRFGRDTGITATFLCELATVHLPWRICFELVRIVQEGLVNVRKHSGASKVDVRFGVRGGYWVLEIYDDGRGLPFEGTWSHSELDVARRGPTIIKERVKAIGGHLEVASAPGKGTRLEIRVPQEAHA